MVAESWRILIIDDDHVVSAVRLHEPLRRS
jgi:hypothetical protein